MELAGRTALLTGATGGLGRAIAATLAGRGATLVLSGRKAEALEALAAELPGEHRATPADLTEPGAAEKLAAEAGDVDILVANAGLPGSGLLADLTAEQVSRALRVNLESPMLMARALYPGMVERGSGHLVFISSISGKVGNPRASIYNATKFGLRGFALGLRTDLAQKGVGVSLVSPGFIRDAGLFADTGAKLPPGVGTGTPQQVGAAVAKAIERDKVEIVVAPIQLRVVSHLAMVTPAISVRAQSGAASQKAAKAVTDAQAEKR
jgi:short-subunit dehydrogenase